MKKQKQTKAKYRNLISDFKTSYAYTIEFECPFIIISLKLFLFCKETKISKNFTPTAAAERNPFNSCVIAAFWSIFEL